MRTVTDIIKAKCDEYECEDVDMAEVTQMEVISVDQMRRSDAYTIENFTPGSELMYRAAYGVYESYYGWHGSSIAIVVGSGNNGGDGYALAGILKKNGIESTLVRVSGKMSEDGRYYHGIATALGVRVCDYTFDTHLDSYDVIVDCILGTGFSGEVRGRAADAIRAINDSNAYVISVDINSGMNGDTGEAVLAVRSDLTVSIGYIKQGLLTGDSRQYIGRLVNVDIGIVLLNSETLRRAIDRCAAAGANALLQCKEESKSPRHSDTGKAVPGSLQSSPEEPGSIDALQQCKAGTKVDAAVSNSLLPSYGETANNVKDKSSAGALYREALLDLLAIMRHIAPEDISAAGYNANIQSTLLMDRHLVTEVINAEADQLSLLSTIVTYIACSKEGLPDHSMEYMDKVTALRKVLEQECNTEAMRFCGSDGC